MPRSPHPLQRETPPPSSMRGIAFLGIPMICFIVLWIISTPVIDWDSMENWLIKSKMIFHQKNLNLQYTYDDHNEYPILWPLSVAAQFTLASGDYDEISKWASALFFVIFLTQLNKGLQLLNVSKKYFWGILLIYIAFFVSSIPFISALPEIPFLTFLSAFFVSVFLWLEAPQDKKRFILILIITLGLNLIKLEGFVATTFIAFCLFFAVRKNLSTRYLGFCTSIILLTTLLPLLWIKWVNMQGFASGISHFEGGLSFKKLPLLIKTNMSYFLYHGEWNVFLIPIAYLTFFPNKRQWNEREIFLLRVCILLMLFKWFAMIGWEVGWISSKGLYPDTTWRLFLHVSPSLILLGSSRAFNR